MSLSIKQWNAFMATLLQNVKPEEIDLDLLQNAIIGDPRRAGDEFTRFLQNGARVQVVVKNFLVWRTIKLGTGFKTADELRTSLKQSSCRIGDWADNLLGQPAFQIGSKLETVDLVNVSGHELGFDRNATFAEICARAKELGLELCPAEVGPQLRLQYLDQPLGEWLLVAMEPIAGSDGRPGAFDVERDDDGLWLYAHDVRPDGVWNPGLRWLFVSRKVVSAQN